MQKITAWFSLTLAVLLFPSFVFSASLSWPASGNNTISLNAPYEPSGLAWNAHTNRLFSVSDPTSDGKNRVTMMDKNGDNKVEWKITGDYEALTIVDPASNYIYIGVENTPAILEFDWTSPSSSPRITKNWSLGTWLSGLGNSGLEGLAFVPNGFHPYANSASGGVFYTGIQREYNLTDGITTNDNLIDIFDVNLTTSGQVTHLGTMRMDPSLPKKDVSDLYFNRDTGTLFILFDDSVNLLAEVKPDGTLLNTYSNVPGSAREGFTLITDTVNNRKNAYVAHDNTPTVTWHTGFTQTYFRDNDGDGRGSLLTTTSASLTPPPGYVSNYLDSAWPEADNDYDNDHLIASLDCDDRNASILGPQNFYYDGDGDGLGAGAASQMCSAQANYVTNNSDLNDQDFDNDGITTANDCDDHNTNIRGKQTYYQDNDGDGLGYGTGVLTCSSPNNYVSNNSDHNDNDFDNDGISLTDDCDDRNSAVLGKQSFYNDADGDGFGFGAPILMCTAQPGLVTNSLDLNDHDYDNDGVTTANDCDDNNVLVLGPQNFYQDNDRDGLGSKTVFINACVNPNTTNYTTNNFDFDDFLSSVGLEVSGDTIDNDGDNIIDEVNSRAENGLHPVLKSLNPKNKSLANRYFLSVTALNNGKVRVMYSDHTTYDWTAYSNYSGPLIASKYNGAVIKVKKGVSAMSAIYLNAYNGARVYNPN